MMEHENEQELELTQNQEQIVHKIVIPAAGADEPKEETSLEQQVWAEDANKAAEEDQELSADSFFDYSGSTTKAAKAKPEKAKTNITQAVKPKEPDKKYGKDFVIVYAGRRIIMPEDDMLLEQVRQWLETDYPEFGKERTEMLIDEEQKFIVPVVKSPKKG